MPATRSGLTGKMGMPGDIGNLDGEGGSIGTGLSLSLASLTVLLGDRLMCGLVVG